VVLDPAGARKNLREFALRARRRLQPGVEGDGARRGRPLVDDENIFAPSRLPVAARTLADR